VRAGARAQKKKEGPRIYRSVEIWNLASRVEDVHQAGLVFESGLLMGGEIRLTSGSYNLTSKKRG
jgi:hypothetical protein